MITDVTKVTDCIDAHRDNVRFESLRPDRVGREILSKRNDRKHNHHDKERLGVIRHGESNPTTSQREDSRGVL